MGRGTWLLVVPLLVAGCRDSDPAQTPSGAGTGPQSSSLGTTSTTNDSGTFHAGDGLSTSDTHSDQGRASVGSTSTVPRRTGTTSASATGATTSTTTAHASSRRATRTPTYDYGCSDEAPCNEQDAEARNGKLRSVVVSEACFLYGPPFASACGTYVSSFAGIRIDLHEDPAMVEVSALIRRDTSTPAEELQACFSLIDQRNRNGAYVTGCHPVPTTGSATIATSIETDMFENWPPADAALYVSLNGEGAAFVDRISYTLP